MRTNLPGSSFRMEILKLDAGFGKCLCDLLEYFELRRSRLERASTAAATVVYNNEGIGRFEESKLCLEADKELGAEFLLRISNCITSSAFHIPRVDHTHFKILFKFVLGHNGTSSRPSIDAFSWKNPNRDACSGAYPHSLRLERSITMR